MTVELPDKLTPVTKEDLISTMWQAWLAYFGAPPPKRDCIWVVCSQIMLETGLKKCHNYNLGNVKSREGDGYDYCYFGCGEEITMAEARRWQNSDPHLVKIVKTYTSKKGVPMASVWVDPKHWASRFRAFDTLTEGATDYLGLLVRRFNLAWEAVEKGDPKLFGHLLKQQNYYTADEAQYTSTLVGVYKMFAVMPFDYDTLPVLTETEKDRLSNLVSLTIQQSVDDWLYGRGETPDDDDPEPNA